MQPPDDLSNSLEVVFAENTDLGEGPTWDEATGTLVFVDSNRGHIYRISPDGRLKSKTDVGQVIGAAIPRRSGGFVATSGNGLLAVEEGLGEVELLCSIEADLPSNRMNDAKCDSRGRLWSGTLSMQFTPGAGSLYRINPDLSVMRAFGGVRVSNGIAWSPDERLIYFNDTLSRGVDVYDFDATAGTISNKRQFVAVERYTGLPDGMTVDAEGCIWVALYFGGAVHRYHPDGTLVGIVTLPVSRVTSCTFGGPDLADLYITTADHRLHPDGRSHEPQAGFLFRCRPGVCGLPSHMFAG